MILDIISLSLFGLAIFVAVAQHLSERNRSRKETTIHAFDILEKEIFF